MPSIILDKRKKRKHNPEILRFRRIARALDIPWREVCQEKDRLAKEESMGREDNDYARQCAWIAHNTLNGWSPSHNKFWRVGFRRNYGRRIATGSDYTSIPQYDLIADAVREECPEYREWETADIWEFLLDDYLAPRPVTDHYSNALASLAFEALAIGEPSF